ncbi:hypothetical protein BGX26_001141 [Mortierella sp. AD094]|nr:hypothetical protein BGX26_001141 [Mortierella sp. AD094]
MTGHQYQRFRLGNLIEEVCVRTTFGSNGSSSRSVSLEDIRDMVKNAVRFKLNGHPIPFLIDSDRVRIEPLRISFYPDEILDVITDIPQSRNTRAVVHSSTPREYKDNVEQTKSENKDMQRVLDLLLEAKEERYEMLTLQHLALDRLAILQKHAEAILVQNFELHEYPIPRLFIILPVDQSKWDPKKVLENKPHHEGKQEWPESNHIARHEGYEIRNGTKFFLKYGKYILVLMRFLRMGMSSVHLSAPLTPIPKLVSVGIDYSIDYMKALSVFNPVLENINTIDDYEELEGADLRQLGSFLRINDQKKSLGNLYRITTDTGHVKWVCIDHYRSTYKEKEQRTFANVVEVNGGKYDPQLGQVNIRPASKIRATEFFDALVKARHIYDLDFAFGWECSRSDLEAFEYALKMSSHNKIGDKGALALSEALKTNTTLISLDLSWNHTKDKGVQELSKALATNTTLTSLGLSSNKIEYVGALALSQALKLNTTLTSLNLSWNWTKDEGALELLEALKTNKTLTSLDLSSNEIEDEGVLALLEDSRRIRF